MQCVNCDFENMPGMSACARCGSVLQFGEICIEPPRASRHRAATHVQRIWNPLRSGFARVRLSSRQLTLLLPEPISLAALFWSIIPGLGHLKTRRPRLGWCILVAWLVFLLLTILSLGTTWCAFFLNLVIVAHMVAIVSLFGPSLGYERLLVRALFGFVIFAGLHLLLYQPIAWACSRTYVLLTVPRIGANDAVSPGEVLLYQGSWTRPESFRRGDLVTYRIDAQQGGGYYIRAGFGLDRVVAVAGDHVQLAEGRLYIDGASPPEGEGPLAALPLLDDFELDVGPGDCLILPTRLDVTLPGGQAGNRRAHQRLIDSVCVVAEDDILGRIVFRLRPLKRLGPVR